MFDEAAKYIYGDKKRIFLNTNLGCSSGCLYCYLPEEGLKINAKQGTTPKISFEKILDHLSVDPRFIPGKSGTMLSIGCFSECWDKSNRFDTQQLIIQLLAYGNFIQLATKRQVKYEDLEPIIKSSNWNGQLRIYVSSASITEWANWEPGTTHPNKRFESFTACRKAGIFAYLYIKPVIPEVTLQDGTIFASVMQKFNVPAIVGEQFNSKASTSITSPISEILYIEPHSDVQNLRDYLKKHGTVYNDSTSTFSKEAIGYE